MYPVHTIFNTAIVFINTLNFLYHIQATSTINQKTMKNSENNLDNLVFLLISGEVFTVVLINFFLVSATLLVVLQRKYER